MMNRFFVFLEKWFDLLKTSKENDSKNFQKKYLSVLLTYTMLCDKLVRVSVKDNRGWLKPGEESPSSIGQDAG